MFASNSRDLRRRCAERLIDHSSQVPSLTAFVGLDGFIDEITHVVDKRDSAENYQRVHSIAALAERIAGAVGKSTNIELVVQQTKLGGNGPILANALACFGIQVTYLGALGYPHLHPIFVDFSRRAEVHSIAEAGQTDALEFDDGKIMFGRSTQLSEVNWKNIQSRFGREKFSDKFHQADLVAFVNWTMLPYMTELWEALVTELCPPAGSPRRRIFFDLADPEKRSATDIARVLEVIGRFEKHFDVILGLNEKEAHEIAAVLGLGEGQGRNSPDDLAALALEIARRLSLDTLAVHPVAFALAVTGGKVDAVEGPVCARPRITTGAGDHFNAGFCLGKLLGFDNAASLLTGVACSGYYVRTAASPNLAQLAELLRHWPKK